MGKPNFSAELPETTLRQIEELKPLFNGNKTQIVIRAISDLYRKEFPAMNIPLNYQPRSEYKGYTVEVATGIGGHYARTSIRIDDETVELLEVGPNDSEQGALQSMRRTIQDALYAHGFIDEPSPHYPNAQ